MQLPQRVEPGPGQESVWDYPRPPRLEAVDEPVRVVFAGQEIAVSAYALRVLETSHPPTIYFPPADVEPSVLIPNRYRSQCEWKGEAIYYDVRVDGRQAIQAAWSYPRPVAAFHMLKDYIAFYPGRVDACYLGDERVRAQRSDIYGGWITSRVVGPFKGPPGSTGW